MGYMRLIHLKSIVAEEGEEGTGELRLMDTRSKKNKGKMQSRARRRRTAPDALPGGSTAYAGEEPLAEAAKAKMAAAPPMMSFTFIGFDDCWFDVLHKSGFSKE